MSFYVRSLALIVASLTFLVVISSSGKVKVNQRTLGETTFAKFVLQHKKSYVNSLSEYHHRSAIFKNNLAKINRLNRREHVGSARYDVNLFTDMTQAEFSSKRLGLKANLAAVERVGAKIEAKLNFSQLWSDLLKEEGKTEEELLKSLPASFDWREHKGAVSDVKDQGDCGSCWAFATTGSIEGQYKIKHNKSVSLSEQELVDCDTVDSGCQGGLPELAYEQIVKLGGLENETYYPYHGVQESCHIKKRAKKFTIDGFVSLPAGDESKMRIWLTKRGPISIGINANDLSFYSRGILHPKLSECPNERDYLDHGVLIVGYGEEKVKDETLPYWIIKNSWTAKWGEKGYFRIFRGDNTCGLALIPSSAVLLK